jgi:hypothetical protein
MRSKFVDLEVVCLLRIGHGVVMRGSRLQTICQQISKMEITKKGVHYIRLPKSHDLDPHKGTLMTR